MNVKSIGTDDGEICGRDGCDGVMRIVDSGSCCSCHICAPCGHCTEYLVCCDKCGEEFDSSKTQFHEPKQAANQSVTPIKPPVDHFSEMDGSKLDWLSFSHSSCSMIKKGKCPLEMTMDQVREKVNGTFGGRFEHWNEATNQHGKQIRVFKFIAYTD
ncbi:hypothetical protein VAWG002_28520 [Aeromonas veronii]|nr:hypothetical protein VAWG002_28520 [Aeromonas veronii]